jgi:hypothetical protein
MRTPKEEREIHIGGYTYQENGTKAERMTIYTSDYSYMAKLDKFTSENPEEWRVENVRRSGDDIVSKEYSCPVGCITFRKAAPKGREMTEEQREALRERFASVRNAPNR